MRKNLVLLLVGVLVGGLMFISAPSPAATTGQRLRRLEAKVVKLQKKTQSLTKQGDYRGFVGGSQVLSLCLDGDPTTWINPIDEITELDACFPPTLSQRQLQKSFGQR